MEIKYLLCLVFGYLIGSVPFALVIGKLFYHKDIRNYGSGNLGGSNAGRVLGKKAGAAVITLDVLKAVLPVVIISIFDYNAAIVCGMAIPFGHCYPIFANFKGGKAVASSFGFVGASLFFQPLPFALCLLLPLLVLYLMVKITKYVSFGSLTSFGLATILSFFVQPNIILSISYTVLWLFIIYRHRNNIKKLLNHTETKVTW